MNMKKRVLRFMVYLSLTVFLLQMIFLIRTVMKSRTLQPDSFFPDSASETSSGNLQIYVRTTSKRDLIDGLENWLLRSMKLFFMKKYLNLVIALDNEKPSDHVYGDKFPQLHPEFNVRVCYMQPYKHNVDHGWPKARMYLDMMYADLCASKEYVGLVDSDAVFVTAVTDDLLFDESGRPVVIGKIGAPDFPCWVKSGAHILGVKQVMQCMSYFPLVFKASHIAEMRRYVETLHGKPFNQVFKETPSMVNDKHCPTVFYCHFSVMCNYMWYHHRNDYAWHLQFVPDGNWDGSNGITAMVPRSYFHNEVKSSEKTPIPRSSIHARFMFHEGVFYAARAPKPTAINHLLREGLCRSFGYEICPQNCLDFKQNSLQESLFKFEHHNWLWDKRCPSTQKDHYRIVHEIVKNEPTRIFINLSNKQKFCSILQDLLLEN